MHARSLPRLLALALVAVAMLAVAPSPEHRAAPPRPETPTDAIDPDLGIFNIDHVIFIVQENRSFDSYFGTFPGADGIPDGVCLPDPKVQGCRRPYHDRNIFDRGGPHNERASRLTINKGKMDGAVVALRAIGNACRFNPARPGCAQAIPGKSGTPDVMGYHTAHEIPNY